MQATIWVNYILFWLKDSFGAWVWASSRESKFSHIWSHAFAASMLTVLFMSGCTLMSKVAVNAVADSLSSGGGVFTSDEDPDLIREAVPFGLKTYESLLAMSPEHEGLLLASASGFASYAFLLQQEADLVDREDYRKAQALRKRASKLFLRGRAYAIRGLELEHKKLRVELAVEPRNALARVRNKDIDFLSWAGAAWAGALGASKDNPLLIADLPVAAAFIERVLELDEAYNSGAAHEFFVAYEGARPGGDLAKARVHFQRAVELSEGKKASVYVSLAESVAVRQQNLAEFKSLIDAALVVSDDAMPQIRVANVLAKRRARWLKNRIPDLFIEADFVGEES